MLKGKLKLTMAVAMSAMFLLAPISVKAESNDLNNFGTPAGFDWEAEKARQKAVFEKFNREHADQIHKKSEISVPNGIFPPNIKKGQPLVTMDSSTCEQIPFIGHAGIVYDGSSTIEAHPGPGVHYGDPNDWWSKKSLYILSSRDTSNMDAAANYAKRQVGKHYNWSFWDHVTTDSFYCSQLVWRSYIDNLGIDLCPGAWSIVSPNDILCSSRLNVDFAFH